MAGKFIGKTVAATTGSQTLAISSIPQNFKHLEIIFFGKHWTYNSYQQFTMKFNNSALNDQATFLVRSSYTNAGAYDGPYGPTTSLYPGYVGGSGATMRMWIPGYTSMTRHKSFLASGGALDSNTWSSMGYVSAGAYTNASLPVTSVSLTASIEGGATLIAYGWV